MIWVAYHKLCYSRLSRLLAHEEVMCEDCQKLKKCAILPLSIKNNPLTQTTGV